MDCHVQREGWKWVIPVNINTHPVKEHFVSEGVEICLGGYFVVISLTMEPLVDKIMTSGGRNDMNC